MGLSTLVSFLPPPLYMHKFILHSLGICLLLLGASCASKQEQSGRRIPPPEAHLTTAKEQALHYIKHYWTQVNLESDSTLLSPKSQLRDLMEDYCGLLSSFPAEEVTEAILTPLKRSSSELLPHMLELYRQELYINASIYSSEDHYQSVLEWSIRSPSVPLYLQQRATSELELLKKNRVGTKATDFIYTLPDSTGRRLSYLNSPYNMLIFASPGCPSCSMVLEDIAQSKEMEALVKSKQLHILVVYVMVNDPDEVGMHAEELPEWFEVGYDANNQILENQLYDIKASPTIYLLDRQSKVLLKDTSSPKCYLYILEQTHKR